VRLHQRDLPVTRIGLARLGQTLGINAVPALGFFAAGWSSGATLAFYWVETVLLTLSVSALIVVHRVRTRRAGHWMGISRAVGVSEISGNGFRSLTEFLSIMIPFSAAHGIVVALLTFQVLPDVAGGGGPPATDLALGSLSAAGFVLLGFVLDLVGIGSRPFAWIEATARGVTGRMVVTHLTILFGLVAIATTDAAGGFFAVFIVLKTAMDFARRTRAEIPTGDPPRWLAWLDRIVPPQKGETFAQFWHRTRGEAKHAETDKERIVPRAR